MKFTIDERLKHRLVGLAVIVSLAAIFAPAIMKKSSERFNETATLSIKLPPKPISPRVDIPEQKIMFETVKAKQVEIPAVEDEPQPLPTIVKAEPLSTINVRHAAPAKRPVKNSRKSKLVKVPSMPVRSVSRLAKIPPRKSTTLALKSQTPLLAKKAIKAGYAVQLATFSQQKNALALIARLKTKGYQGRFSTVVNKNGTLYKVVVGSMPERLQAQKLQQQLAISMQIKGFVVPSEVG